jgi:hypothetical protein
MSEYEDPIFGPIIHRYTRAQAIEDGVLFDLSTMGRNTAHEAGFRIRVVCTAMVYHECIALTAAAERAGNVVEGRLWDVLYMAARAARAALTPPRGCDIYFTVNVVRKRAVPTPTKLKLTITPDDDVFSADYSKAVVTILFPEED